MKSLKDIKEMLSKSGSLILGTKKEVKELTNIMRLLLMRLQECMMGIRGLSFQLIRELFFWIKECFLGLIKLRFLLAK